MSSVRQAFGWATGCALFVALLAVALFLALLLIDPTSAPQ